MYIVTGWILAVLLLGQSLQTVTLAQSGTCSKDSPCETGCCGKEGNCGFGPTFCGDDVCISNCDAKAECGKYATEGSELCPLNVCCSQFGFCGTSKDFCSGKCQSGCEPVEEPSCSGTSASKRYIGYYESFNTKRACDKLMPENIDVNPWTHLNFAFAVVDESDSTITTMNDYDSDYYPSFTGLKKQKPSMKTFISVGGWDAGGKGFSNMVSSSQNREKFINSAGSFMGKYGFDGIDLDWEYPAAADRGGKAADTENLNSLLSEMKDAFNDTYGITATLPSSYWYLKGFDVSEMAKYLDWFNVMTYDIHGTWDGQSKWTSPNVNPHTNLTEITAGLDLLWRNSIDPGMVVLGLGFYGRSFTLQNPDCDTPGCPFSKSSPGAKPGECTGTSGILSDYEINRIIKKYSPKVTYNSQAGVNWMTWNSTQWVSFDDPKTLKQKYDYANQKCLGGTFGWAIDMGGPGTTTSLEAMKSNASSLDGADINGKNNQGKNSSSGDVYIDAEIYNNGSNPTVGCIPPCNFILPPISLESSTTVSFPPYVTSMEVAWPTGGGYARTIQTTTLTIPPVTTDKINVWNWNITETDLTSSTYAITSSILPAPFTITDNPPTSSSSSSSVVAIPIVTRTITPPPFPYTSTYQTSGPLPTLTFESGAPTPTCLSNCGKKCEVFCDEPCLDCVDGGDDFIDPIDPNPPNHRQCSGPDCHNDRCIGNLCVDLGCTGSDCDSRVCLGPDCLVTACLGTDCEDGHCVGPDCQGSGCWTTSGCDSDGLCKDPSCFSWGCEGPDCGDNHLCTGPDCSIITCHGSNCKYGYCIGPGCEVDDGSEKKCEKSEAPLCKEYITSYTPVSQTTMTTSTDRSCQTITACGAEASTTTTTVSSKTVTYSQTNVLTRTKPNESKLHMLADSIMSRQSRMEHPTPKSTAAEPTSTTDSQVTTTSSPTPSETSYSCKGSIICSSFPDLKSFCDQAKGYLTETTIYGTKSDDQDTGACYTDNSHAKTGCGVFVEGKGCEMDGKTIAAAYDHLRNNDEESCGICGHVNFSDGCKVTVNYVQGCDTTNNGPLQPALPPGESGNATVSPPKSSSSRSHFHPVGPDVTSTS